MSSRNRSLLAHYPFMSALLGLIPGVIRPPEPKELVPRHSFGSHLMAQADERLDLRDTYREKPSIVDSAVIPYEHFQGKRAKRRWRHREAV